MWQIVLGCAMLLIVATAAFVVFVRSLGIVPYLAVCFVGFLFGLKRLRQQWTPWTSLAMAAGSIMAASTLLYVAVHHRPSVAVLLLLLLIELSCLIILVASAGVFLASLISRYRTRCPACKRWGAAEVSGEEFTAEMGSYNFIYRCRYCAHNWRNRYQTADIIVGNK